MAISFVGANAWVSGTGNITPTIHASAATGDMMLCRIGTKPYNGTNTMPAGWVSLGTFADGTVGAGNGVGSMKVEVFWKEHDGSEANPLVTNATNNVSGAGITVYRKGAGESWVTPVGDGGPDTTVDASKSMTVQSHVSVVSGDWVDFFLAVRDNTTMTVPDITQAGVTFAAVVEAPAAALTTTSGGDMAADGGYREATSGTSSAAAVITGTLSTNETGSAWMTRLRVSAGGSAVDRTATDSLTAGDSVARVATGIRSTANAIVNSDAVTRLGVFGRTATEAVTASDAAVAVVGGSAFPVVAGQNSGTNATGTAHPFTYDTSPSAGDLLILEISFDDFNDGTATVDTDAWITVVDVIGNSAATAQRSYVFARYASGSEGTGGNVTFTVSEASAWIVRRITGHNVTSNSDITSALGFEALAFQPSSQDTTYDPPSLTPSNFGAGDNLAGGGGGWDGASGGAHVSYPTDLTDNRASAFEGTVGIASGTVETTAASYNPGTGAFTASDQWSSWTWMVEPVAAGGASVSRTATDAVTGSDAATRLAVGLRSIADAITGSDVATRAAAFPRSVTDALAASDVATRILTYARSVADAITASDVASRTGTFGRSVTDAITGSDVATRIASLPRSVTDAITGSDVATRLLAYVRSVADTITASDVATRVASFPRSVADTITGSDVATRVSVAARTVADAISASDVAVAVKAITRSATDALTAGDVATRTGLFLRSVADAVAASDVATRTGSFLRSVADAISASDVATQAKATARSAVDALAAGDVATRTGAFLRSVSDASGLSDVAARVVSLPRSVADAIVASDVATRAGTFLRSVTDAFTGSDVATRTTTYLRSVADAVTGSDAATRTVALLRSVADAANLSDVATRIIAGAGAVARFAVDAITASDVAVRSVSLVRSVADTVTGSDAATAIRGLIRSTTDAIAASDVATRLLAAVRSVDDSLTAADVPTRTVDLVRGTGESVAVSDVAVGALTVFTISGYTRDENGTIIPNCVVDVFVASTNTFYDTTTSDGTGFYTINVDGAVQYFLVAYDVPETVFGTTQRDLEGV